MQCEIVHLSTNQTNFEMKKQLLFLILAIFGTFQSIYAQPTCGSLFTDPAGPNGNYANNTDVTTTICPANVGEVVTINFSSFALETNFDFLKVYNGPSTTSPLLANLTGLSIPPSITSTDPSGCLTFVFTSDSSVNYAGWIANIICTQPVSPNCVAPTSPIVSNVTAASATIGWTAGSNETSWNLNIGTAGSSTTSIAMSQNPFVLVGLDCNTVYNFSITAVCGNFVSLPSNQVSFATLLCSSQPGQPVDLFQCSLLGQACFDLTENNLTILGDLNPSDYVITYHETLTDANTGSNSLVSPYCSLSEVQTIYTRLTKVVDNSFQILTFTINVQSFSSDIIALSNMEECDVDNNGLITFNFTTNAAQINTTNTLTYYASLTNAQNEVNPLAVPSSFVQSVQPNPIVFFIRETVPHDCDTIYSFQVRAYANCNIASTCSGANSLCNSLGVPFQNTVNAGSTGQAGCLGSTPNQTWFYLPVSSAGTINLKIEQTVAATGQFSDVDYIVYGPFTSLTTACSQATPNTIVSCSFSAASIEFPVIPNAQPGQYYLMMVTNFSNLSGLITITALGTSTGAIDCSGLRLNAFLDTNNNSIKDTGEQNFTLGQFEYELNNDAVVHNVISSTGVYTIYDTNAANSYDLSYSIDPNYLSYYGISTSSYDNVNVVIGSGVQTYNFPITVAQPYTDLAINIVPDNAPRPGFSYQNKIVYTNNGNQIIAAGTVTFENDSDVTIIANSQAGVVPTATGFTHNFTNLLPFETRIITVTMQVPNIPTVALGDLLTNTASIVPVNGDLIVQNNSSSCSQIIIGSYDPNDKMESRGERVLFSSFGIDDYLYYTIRFENTGTASAINVRINDVLDNQIDESSLRMISSSHSYVLERVDNNLTWRFDNIFLPVSVADTEIGKGYVTFQVKLKPGFALGDIIPNTALIYFDFNPAIITNTFRTEFVQQLGINDFENGDFIFYPNPVSDVVTISVKDSSLISTIAVYDVLGKQILVKKPSDALSTQTLDLSAIAKGIYLLEVTSNAAVKVVKKLIVE